jgi:molybdate transport system substrate-binding protein
MRRIALAASVLLTLASPAAARADEVMVFAAASLTDALEEIGRTFEAKAGGTRVTFNFGASSDLARQIRAGARADVFFSADSARMDELAAAGLVRRSDRADVLSNSLAVVVPSDSTLRLAGPSDLRSVRRIALADPQAVPAGIYARQYLEQAGLWAALADRVVPLLDVRAALAAVERGEADAGIVYHTDAAGSRRAKVAFEVPREAGPRIVYPMAVLAESAKPAARSFAAFLLCAQARAVFERYGFTVIAPPPAC